MRRKAIIGTGALALNAALFACYDEDEYGIGTDDGVPISDVVQLTCADSSVAAGRAVECTATVLANLDKSLRKVTFDTDLGAFVADGSPAALEVTASRAGVASVVLVSGAPGIANVTATIADVRSDEFEITFEPLAGAAQVASITANGFALQATARHELELTVQLTTAEGTVPRPRETMSLELYRDSTGSVAHDERRIRAQTTSDASGGATALITAGETDYRGPVWVRACPGATVEASACAWLELVVVDAVEL